MDSNPEKDFNRSFFGVLGGVFSSIAIGYLAKIAFEKIFHVDPFSTASGNIEQDKITLEIILGAWLFISSFAGGLICAMIVGRNDVSHIIISSLVVLALYFIISGGGVLKEQSLASWAILLVIPFGYFIGEWLGTYKKRGT